MLSDKKIDYYLKKIDSPSNKILSDTFKKLNAELQSVNLSFMAKVSLKTLFKESVRLRGRYNQYVLRNSDLVADGSFVCQFHHVARRLDA